MTDFTDRVAVVTGAASGIGRALAELCAREGMKVVLADIEESALEKARLELMEAGAEVTAVKTDVSRIDEVANLADRTLSAYGRVHLLFNNAGVGAGSTAWETTVNDWRWVLGVNLWGVIHGLQVFVPLMMEGDATGHIVNTASLAGLISYHQAAPYLVTKHAVVALSEKLYYDLQRAESKVSVSVLCPAWVQTRIMDSQRNRPPELRDTDGGSRSNPTVIEELTRSREACENGMSPIEVANIVFKAIREQRFYIYTDPEFQLYVNARADAVVEGRNPLPLDKLMESVTEH